MKVEPGFPDLTNRSASPKQLGQLSDGVPRYISQQSSDRYRGSAIALPPQQGTLGMFPEKERCPRMENKLILRQAGAQVV
jgi:hypothetical protein